MLEVAPQSSRSAGWQVATRMHSAGGANVDVVSSRRPYGLEGVVTSKVPANAISTCGCWSGLAEAIPASFLGTNVEQSLRDLLLASEIRYECPESHVYRFVVVDDDRAFECEVRFRRPRFAVCVELGVQVDSSAGDEFFRRVNDSLLIGALTVTSNGMVRARVSVNHAGVNNASWLLANALRDVIRVAHHYTPAVDALAQGIRVDEIFERLVLQ